MLCLMRDIRQVFLHEVSNLKVGHIRHYRLRDNGPSFMSLKVPAADIVSNFLCVHWYYFECHSVLAKVRSLICLVCT